MKNAIPFTLLVFAGLACSNTSRPANESTMANANRIVSNTTSPLRTIVKADDLIRAYKANELAGDDKYRGKPLEVTGRVSEISDTLGTLTADLRADNYFEIVTVKCTFPDSERNTLMKLVKGSVAAFRGTGDGMTAGLYVGLTDCSVK